MSKRTPWFPVSIKPVRDEHTVDLFDPAKERSE